MASFASYSTQLIPALSQMRGIVESAFKYTVEQVTGGNDIVVEDVAKALLAGDAGKWDPKVSGASVLDTPTRIAGIRFLAGVGFNLAMRGRVARGR